MDSNTQGQRVVTLTTDFGLSDPFVGVMKGVILRQCSGAHVIDLCHGIAPQDRRAAAYWTARCHPWFPAGTLHVVVVDPTVGTERRILAVQAHGHLFLLPDNGIVGSELTRAEDFCARVVDVSGLGLGEPSRTFHGRDVFAPVAARLAGGTLRFEDLGPTTSDLAPPVLRGATLERRGSRMYLCGEVALLDRFGNVISDVPTAPIPKDRQPRVSILEHSLAMFSTYAHVDSGELLALGNSFGSVEIAVRDGSAAARLGVERGAIDEGLAVVVTWEAGPNADDVAQ